VPVLVAVAAIDQKLFVKNQSSVSHDQEQLKTGD